MSRRSRQRPQRRYNSFRISVLTTSADAYRDYLERIVSALYEKKIRKHFYKYVFIWRNAQITQLHRLLSAVWQR